MFQNGSSAATTMSYLAAVQHTQIAIGLGDAIMVKLPQLQHMLKGACQ